MRWAANRRTTRKEDIAYCLLGVFGVNMSLIYGEGENAFKRLQEEIIRQSDDESIFAWGLGRPGDRDSSLRLLAKSPTDFMGCDEIRVLSDCTIGNQDQILALPLVGNLTTDGQLRAGPGTKPVLVSAKIFEATPISRVYLRTSEWTMPYESESYPTSCTGLSLGNARHGELVEIIHSLQLSFETKDFKESTASQMVLFRLRGANNRIYLVGVVMSFQQQFGVDYKRVAPEFGVLEEPRNASLAEFILEEYIGGSPSLPKDFQPHSSDGYLQLNLDDSLVNWVLELRVGYELPLRNSLPTDLTPYFPDFSVPKHWKDGIMSEIKTEDVLPEMAQPSGIKTGLKRHQRQGLWFMMLRESQQDMRHVWQPNNGPNGFPIWVNDIDGSTRENFPPVWRGGILADTTGLGKTLQMISLIVAQKSTQEQVSNVTISGETLGVNLRQTSATLVVLPEMTMISWREELKRHVSPGALSWTYYHNESRFDGDENVNLPDVVLATYGTVASEYKQRDTLFQYHWHRVIIDEG
ncbi:hypothetical protein ABKA04_003924 [Annulohypoxylon sp. FPYF3050]